MALLLVGLDSATEELIRRSFPDVTAEGYAVVSGEGQPQDRIPKGERGWFGVVSANLVQNGREGRRAVCGGVTVMGVFKINR